MSETILCDHPGPGGSTCVKPYGHTDEQGHAYAMSMELPPDVGRMFGAMLADLEETTKRMKRQERFYSRWKYAWMGLFGVYLVLIIAKAFGA